MKKYKLILFLSTAFLSVACTDSFFDLEPSSSVPTDKVYKTADDFNVAVMGCYSKLQTQVSYFTECCEYRSDNLTLSAPTAGTQDRYDIDQFADKASSTINNQGNVSGVRINVADGVVTNAQEAGISVKTALNQQALCRPMITIFK